MPEEIDIADISVEDDGQASLNVPGEAITTAEIGDRLSDKLYRQLSDGSDSFVAKAIYRAEVYVMAIISRFGLTYTLDDLTMREITMINAVAELHIALGNIEGAKELRSKAKDLVLAAYGDYPDTDSTSEPEGKQVGTVKRQRPGRIFAGY